MLAVLLSVTLLVTAAAQAPPQAVAPTIDPQAFSLSSRSEAAAMQSRKRGPFRSELTALAWAPWAWIGIAIALAMGCQRSRRRDAFGTRDRS